MAVGLSIGRGFVRFSFLRLGGAARVGALERDLVSRLGVDWTLCWWSAATSAIAIPMLDLRFRWLLDCYFFVDAGL